MLFTDLKFLNDPLKDEINQAIQEVIGSGWYLNGDSNARFEENFAAYCGARHAVGVANGLDAIYSVLRSAGVGPGDEVIVPAHTFIATWLAVSLTGATLVPVDADPVTMNWDITLAINAITSRTKAMIPVHLYGQMIDMKRLKTLLSSSDILLIEDAAQAHGAERDGFRAGAAGTAGCFSFYPAKNLGAFGDAGAVTTSDETLASGVRAICNYGAQQKYEHKIQGMNSRMDEIQAAVLRVKLTALDRWNQRRREVAMAYLSLLDDVDDIRMPGVDSTESGHVWHLFVIRVLGNEERRRRFLARLQDKGIPAQIHYPVPNHHSGAYAQDFSEASFPHAEAICRSCISLPIGPHIMDSDVDRVADVVRRTAIEVD